MSGILVHHATATVTCKACGHVWAATVDGETLHSIPRDHVKRAGYGIGEAIGRKIKHALEYPDCECPA